MISKNVPERRYPGTTIYRPGETEDLYDEKRVIKSPIRVLELCKPRKGSPKIRKNDKKQQVQSRKEHRSKTVYITQEFSKTGPEAGAKTSHTMQSNQ